MRRYGIGLAALMFAGGNGASPVEGQTRRGDQRIGLQVGVGTFGPAADTRFNRLSLGIESAFGERFSVHFEPAWWSFGSNVEGPYADGWAWQLNAGLSWHTHRFKDGTTYLKGLLGNFRQRATGNELSFSIAAGLDLILPRGFAGNAEVAWHTAGASGPGFLTLNTGLGFWRKGSQSADPAKAKHP